MAGSDSVVELPCGGSFCYNILPLMAAAAQRWGEGRAALSHRRDAECPRLGTAALKTKARDVKMTGTHSGKGLKLRPRL